MSRHRWRVLPSSSSSRMYFPPRSEALCPSLGCARREVGGPWAVAWRGRGWQRGGERVRGGITVLCMETSPRDWAPDRDMEGTTPCPATVVREPGWVSSSGLTLPGRMGWMEVSGEREGRLGGLVSIMLTR